MLLSILENILLVLSMDFVLDCLAQGLSRFYTGYGQYILKMTHFIACKKAKNDPSVTYLFFQKVVSLHNVPKTIILKRDVEFISKF